MPSARALLVASLLTEPPYEAVTLFHIGRQADMLL